MFGDRNQPKELEITFLSHPDSSKMDIMVKSYEGSKFALKRPNRPMKRANRPMSSLTYNNCHVYI